MRFQYGFCIRSTIAIAGCLTVINIWRHALISPSSTSISSLPGHIPEEWQNICQFLELSPSGVEGKFENPKYRLRGLGIVFRHGERSPLVAENDETGCLPYREEDRKSFVDYVSLVKSEEFQYFLLKDKAFAHLSELPESARCGGGQLTAEGALTHRELGKYMRKRYSTTNIFNPEAELNVTVTSSKYNRTFQSAIAFSSGFLYPLKAFIPQLYFKATNHTFMCTAEQCSCPEAREWRYKYEKEHASVFYKNAPAQLKQETYEINEIPAFKDSHDPFQVMDVSLGRYICRRKTLPCHGDKCLSFDYLSRLLNYTTARGTFMYNEGPHYIAKKLQLVEANGVLYHLVQAIRFLRRFPHTNVIRIFSGHDVTVGPLLRVLQVPFVDFPRYASRLVFELYSEISNTNNILVRVIYNGVDVTNKVQLCERLVDDLCPADYFEKFLPEIKEQLGGIDDMRSFCFNRMEDSLNSFITDSDEESPQHEVPSTSGQSKATWFGLASEKLKRAGNILSEKSERSKTDIKNKMWATWNSLKYSGKWISDQTGEYDKQGQILLLGRFYAPEGSDGLVGSGFVDFIHDYYSRLWITYRTGFEPFPQTQISTDCGWGCMLRSAQMMVGHAISTGRLKRNWRFRGRKASVLKKRKPESESDEYFPDHIRMSEQEHLSIVKLFEDCPDAPLGIHRLVELAKGERGDAAVGSWYSASEAVSLMRRAVASSASPLTCDLSVLLCVNGHLSMGEAERLSRNWTKKLLIVVTVRFGTTSVNKVYYPHIRQLFSVKTCMGMLGGRPDHSLFFVGFYRQQVIYLDPHVAHEYVPLDETINGFEPERKHPLSSYHCKTLSKMPLEEMDPSCAVGFLVHSAAELEETVKELNLNQVIDVDLGEGEGEKRTRDPLFTVIFGEERKSSWNREDLTTQEEKDLATEHGFELL